MEFDTTRGACPWNSDQNCTQNLAMLGGGLGVVGVRDEGSLGVGGSGGSRGWGGESRGSRGQRVKEVWGDRGLG